MATAAKRRNRYRTYEGVSYTSYDGSAARQLEQGAEILQPRPLVRPRERAVARPRVQVRQAGSVSVFAVLLLMSYVQLNTIAEQVVSLRSEMSALQSEEAKLRAQYELSYDLSEIEQSLTADGSMVKPQNGQVIYVDLSEPDAVTFYDREEPLSGLRGAFESVKSICGEIVEYFQ